MNSTIVRQFGSGQITIPKKWRDELGTTAYRAHRRGREIVLSPVETEDIIFDAERDNAGKAIPAKDFIKLLKRAMK